ncbi:uncharacterized protein LOC141652510 [Silene latifolia]|uniref:uncharacterized protein LOC141652510 n=1 Tax=Silene latifolia TaxID=37657 RepID=UPI003D775023
MRGSFSLLRNTNGVIRSTVIGEASKLVSCSTFSTSSGPGGGSGGGGGRGRGRGSFANPRHDFVAGSSDPGKMNSNEDSNSNDRSYPSTGRGHGRGNPLPLSPFSPSPNTFVAPDKPPQQYGRGNPLPSSPFSPSPNTFVAPGQPPQQQPGVGRGRGGMADEGESRPKGPILFRKEDGVGSSSFSRPVDSVRGQPQNIVMDGIGSNSIPGPVDFVRDQPQNIVKDGIGSSSIPGPVVSVRDQPQNIVKVLTGTGRGKPERKPVHEERPKENNRHLRPRRDGGSGIGFGRGRDRLESKESSAEPKTPKLSREEAIKHAVGILARKDGETTGGRGRGRGRGKGRGRDRDSDDESGDEEGLFMGNDADGEKLAQKLGPTVMAELTEAFEDLSSEILPDPAWDEYVEAYDTNLKHELEPEYLMGDFETNPDIHENPPIPLREALEKMKPFLMSYEGIESQEEWEEAMKETMERVPLLKSIVNHYCGPDRVTAKQQQGELERVAKTLPASAPKAVTRFTDRAVLSLQSNPGWGFHRKWQLMDKIVDEFSKTYK